MGLAEMLRFESKFSFICNILFSFQHAEPENHYLADSCWHGRCTGVGSEFVEILS